MLKDNITEAASIVARPGITALLMRTDRVGLRTLCVAALEGECSE